MKCGTKTIAQLTPQQRKRLIDEVQKGNELFLKEQCERMKVSITGNVFKLVVLAANESLGLGRERIERMLAALNKNVSECEDRDDFWLVVERDCKKILTPEVYNIYFRDEPFILN